MGLNLGLNHVASEYVSPGYIDIYGYLAQSCDGNVIVVSVRFGCLLLAFFFF